MRWPPRVFYCAQAYESFHSTALAYRRCLSQFTTLVDDPREADVSILQGTPDILWGRLRAIPALDRTYVVGSVAWEARGLPAGMRSELAPLDEVWAPSLYCLDMFAGAHDRMRWLPHIVSSPSLAPPPSPAEARVLDAVAAWAAGGFVFLSLFNEPQTRKNIEMVARAFHRVRREVPSVRLVLKGHAFIKRGRVVYASDQLGHHALAPGMTLLTGHLGAGGMRRLYTLASAVVSAHHSEGWGLTMSEAMSLGVPVIASDYSGSRAFATAHNSLPVVCEEGPIAEEDQQLRFTRRMRWGAVMQASLEAQMRRACQPGADRDLAALVKQARADVQCYSASRVGRRMRGLLANIVRRVRTAGGLARLRRETGRKRAKRR